MNDTTTPRSVSLPEPSLGTHLRWLLPVAATVIRSTFVELAGMHLIGHMLPGSALAMSA